MALPTSAELLALLRSDEPGLAKGGLQTLCYAIEGGRTVDLTRDPRLFLAIIALKEHPDMFVRRWLYKLIALLRIEQLSPWIAGQMSGKEADPENISWAASALHVLSGEDAARRVIARSHVDPDDPVIRLAAGYFRRGTQVDKSVLRRATASDDPLAHRWIGLRYGNDPASVPRAVLADLVSSETPSVVEYSVWAVHNDPRGQIQDIALHPQDFATFAPSVRRWYLRVILKNPANLYPYADLIFQAMNDPNVTVREGVALGLSSVPFDQVIADELLDWFSRERAPLVRFAIARVMYGRRRRYPRFKEALQQERDQNASPIGDAFQNAGTMKASKIFISSQRRSRMPSVRSTLPRIIDSRQENVYLLGIDTVDFSQRTDKQQYAIFRDLLDSLHHERIVTETAPENIATLLTGDGIFVGFRDVESRLSPLHVAFGLRRIFRELRSYELRFGVNSGPATWIFLNNGGPQLISHAVNWTARVMSAAGGNEVFASDSYYRHYVVPALDDFPGSTFEAVEGLRTKHDESLAVWRCSQ